MSFLQLRSTKFNNILDTGPLPQVSTQAATGVGSSAATGNGTLISYGATPVTAMGFVYSSSNLAPTLADSVVTDAGVTVGTFSDTLGSLSPSTVYYYRAYATNSQGTAYGQILSFTTSVFVASLSSTLLLMGVA